MPNLGLLPLNYKRVKEFKLTIQSKPRFLEILEVEMRANVPLLESSIVKRFEKKIQRLIQVVLAPDRLTLQNIHTLISATQYPFHVSEFYTQWPHELAYLICYYNSKLPDSNFYEKSKLIDQHKFEVACHLLRGETPKRFPSEPYQEFQSTKGRVWKGKQPKIKLNHF